MTGIDLIGVLGHIVTPPQLRDAPGNVGRQRLVADAGILAPIDPARKKRQNDDQYERRDRQNPPLIAGIGDTIPEDRADSRWIIP